jgi:hypothetical protein
MCLECEGMLLLGVVCLAVDETSDCLNCALLGYYALSSGNSLPTSRCIMAQKSAVLIHFAKEA